jgi:hypothetical protein
MYASTPYNLELLGEFTITQIYKKVRLIYIDSRTFMMVYVTDNIIKYRYISIISSVNFKTNIVIGELKLISFVKHNYDKFEAVLINSNTLALYYVTNTDDIILSINHISMNNLV